MEIKQFKKTIEVEMFNINDCEISVSDLYEMITDGFLVFILIHDYQLKNILEEAEVIKVSSRGSCYKGPKFEWFCEQVGLNTAELL